MVRGHYNYFNSIKVQLELAAFKAHREQNDHFNSIKVQLELLTFYLE